MATSDTTRMRRVLVLVAVLCLLVASGCGNKSKTVTSTNASGQVSTQTVPDVHFAKTKFLLHSGLAFGAFHRYILKPFRGGLFSKGAPGRVKALVKAGAAALFAAHELKQANRAALSDNRLRPLAQKLDGLAGRLASLGPALKSGSFSPAALLGANKIADSVAGQSSGLGATIKDKAVPALGG
jgi:hypothetical protein